MTLTAAWIMTGILVLGLSRVALVRQLRCLYCSPRYAWPVERPLPKAAVILSLRGHDPYLTACLRNLLCQDYPDFIVRVVIDSVTDPSWAAIRAVQNGINSDLLKVSVLRNRDSSCSLKNSSIIQAIGELPADCEVVVFVDADSITHPTWLQELIAPFAESSIACTTGVRWFAPQSDSFADRLRCHWNLLAAAMIYQTQIPWGGSMAIRRTVLDSGLTAAWSRMFCEDCFTIAHLRSHGLKLACVPQATIVNEERTSVRGCISFVSRQTLILRLYHRAWWAVAAAVGMGIILRFGHVYFAVRSLFFCDWLSLFLLLSIDPVIVFATFYEGRRLDNAVRDTVRARGGQIAANPIFDSWGYICNGLLVVAATLYALCARHVKWRGVTYRIKGPTQITMLGYSPFIEASGGEGVAKATVI